MKITKQRLKQIIKEELESFLEQEPPPTTSRVVGIVQEEEPVDLGKLQPAAESAAEQVLAAVEKEAGGEESLENLLVQAIIAQLQASVG